MPYRPQVPPPPPRSDSVVTPVGSQVPQGEQEWGRQETWQPIRGWAGGQANRAQSRGASTARPPHPPGTSRQSQGCSGGLPRSSQTSAEGMSQAEQSQAPERNLLARIQSHKNGGWKKDLDCYMGSYFWLNYQDAPTGKWVELKTKFFDFLIHHHREWKSIWENDPLGYLL